MLLILLNIVKSPFLTLLLENAQYCIIWMRHNSYNQTPILGSSQYFANVSNASLIYLVDKSLSNIIIISVG